MEEMYQTVEQIGKTYRTKISGMCVLCVGLSLATPLIEAAVVDTTDGKFGRGPETDKRFTSVHEDKVFQSRRCVPATWPVTY
jgi:hypothetical protein